MRMEERVYKKGDDIEANILYRSKVNLLSDDVHDSYLHSRVLIVNKLINRYRHDILGEISISIKVCQAQLMEIEHFEHSKKCKFGYYKPMKWKIVISTRENTYTQGNEKTRSCYLYTNSIKIQPTEDEVMEAIKKIYDCKVEIEKQKIKNKEKKELMLKIKKEKEQKEKIKKDLLRDLLMFDDMETSFYY